jgi:hypothetical protein
MTDQQRIRFANRFFTVALVALALGLLWVLLEVFTAAHGVGDRGQPVAGPVLSPSRDRTQRAVRRGVRSRAGPAERLRAARVPRYLGAAIGSGMPEFGVRAGILTGTV